MKTTLHETDLRAASLDTFRGYAILTMVLSGAIAFGILPGWMYHGQTPPPDHTFNPEIYGITWVDLVFPFFIFAMGAAFPFSVGRKLEKGEPEWKVSLQGLFRGLKLAFFAIFIQHFYPWVVGNPQDHRTWFTTLAAFALLFPMFMRLPWKVSAWIRFTVQAMAYGIAVWMLLTVRYADGRTFDLGYSNIIILVLADMAVFGTLVYALTWKNRLFRIGILPFIMAVMLGGTTNSESWNVVLYNYSPVPWLYRFVYLKYLFIIIPGTVAGEYLSEWIKSRKQTEEFKITGEKKTALILLFLCLTLIVFNLYGLYTRRLALNLCVTTILLVFGWYMFRIQTITIRFWKNLFTAGFYLLLLGLFFEAFEGGIRKDHSTYSYYFVTSGLAFFGLMFFSIVCDYFKCRKSTAFLSLSGQNPMIAYVGSSMLVIPLLKITRVYPLLDYLTHNPWLGFLRGVIITGLVALLAMFFTKIKWFWRT
ncbi:MAG: DUF5009 domain-containing protein [Dysgonamonadaceae bacterium]|nr:DUF5009 domain-containing protein [Dysgonamonadaceae bacterium]